MKKDLRCQEASSKRFSTEQDFVLLIKVRVTVRDAGAQGRWRGGAPPALHEQGQGANVPFLCCLFINFFIFSSYIHSFVKLDLLLSSGIHALPRNIYFKMLQEVSCEKLNFLNKEIHTKLIVQFFNSCPLLSLFKRRCSE